ncbi:uncharacterized protein [Nicotiana tomentosiformis]|uniref:uncharacterized protein n=1 Tax=Nicotiana tomentosiformis TaxID=4098 RepID=UPI00388CE5DC
MAGGTNAELRQRVEQLEALVGQALEMGSDSSVLARMARLEADYAARYETTLAEMALVRKDEEELREEVVQLRRALQNNAPRNNDRTKMRIPEPKAYGGARSAKELENFLWDMEQYFLAARVPNDEKVTITPMYLTDDAKVWWRTRVVEAESAGLPKIETWETLKKELKSQFLPTNSSWVARDGLRHLKQSGTVREYVKEFSSLMLNVSNMAEEDKLHFFMSGLKGWAQLELRRQNVQSLSTAIAAADALADLNIGHDSTESSHSKSDGRKDKGKEWKKSGKGQAVEDGGLAKNGRQTETSKGKDRGGKFSGCFTCGGPHLKRDCPVQARVNVMLAAERQEQVAEANAIVANVNAPTGELFVNNPLGLIR